MEALTALEKKILKIRTENQTLCLRSLAKMMGFSEGHTSHVIASIRKKGYFVPRSNAPTRVIVQCYRAVGKNKSGMYHAVYSGDKNDTIAAARERGLLDVKVEKVR